MSEVRRICPAVELGMGAAGRGGGREKRRELRSSLPVGELMAFDMTATIAREQFVHLIFLSSPEIRRPVSLPLAANAKIAGHVTCFLSSPSTLFRYDEIRFSGYPEERYLTFVTCKVVRDQERSDT